MEAPKDSLFKRTDSRVKTVEAWWAFLQALWDNRGVIAVIGGFAGLFGSAAYNAFEAINSLGWAGWVLALIPSVFVVGLLALFLVWVVEIINRLRGKPSQITETHKEVVAEPLSQSGRPAYFDDFARNVLSIQQSLDGRLDTILDGLQGLQQRTEALEQKLAPQVRGLLVFSSDKAPESRLDTIESEIQAVRSYANGALEGLAAMVRESNDLLAHHVKQINQSHLELANRTHTVFRDKQHYQLLKELEVSIADGIATLDKLSSNDPDKPSFEQWTEVFKEWEFNVREFSRIATEYKILQQPLWHTVPDEYKASAWNVTASDVGSEDALHDFKTYRLLRRNFEEHANRIVSFVRGKAWV